jgi:heptosyltransferase-2
MQNHVNYKFDCRLFNGYKPCKHKRACDGCPHYDPVGERVAILHTEALGAVLRSTCLLEPIKKKYPKAHITWITFASAKALLDQNPYIDRILTVDGPQGAGVFDVLEFDILYSVDKSITAGALAEKIKAKQKFGFGLTPQGVIRPLTEHARYQYDLGLDDHLKFRVNQKPETQQTTESMGLEWTRDQYVLELTPKEKAEAQRRRELVVQGRKGVIGYNTGCSLLYPFKKFTVEHSIEIIKQWRQTFPDFVVALMGGREDTERHKEMKAAFASDPFVVDTPTTEGLRSGVLWMDTADIVLSGCSLGMHIAIARKKHVIAWFGVSCLQEVDLYDRGTRIQSEVTCSPCWRQHCENEPKCFNSVPASKIMEATRDNLKALKLL